MQTSTTLDYTCLEMVNGIIFMNFPDLLQHVGLLTAKQINRLTVDHLWKASQLSLYNQDENFGNVAPMMRFIIYVTNLCNFNIRGYAYTKHHASSEQLHDILSLPLCIILLLG